MKKLAVLLAGFLASLAAAELVLEPLRPDIVLDLNGANDVFLPLTRGNRPGDAYQTGEHCALYYHDSPLRALARYSCLARFLCHESLTWNALARPESAILSDGRRAQTLAESVLPHAISAVEGVLRDRGLPLSGGRRPDSGKPGAARTGP